MGYAGKFDALDTGNGYPLLLKLGLNPPPQFTSYFILTRWRGSHLQPNCGSGAVKVLHAEDTRTVHQRRSPGGVIAQSGSGGIECLERFVAGSFRRQRHVDKCLRPVTAKVADGADLAIGYGYQSAARVADDG